MKTRIKGIAFLLAVILTFAGIPSGSAPIPVGGTPPTSPELQAPPTTAPETVPTLPPTTAEPTVPVTTVPPVPTVPPTTAPTEPPTTAPTVPPTTVPPATETPTVPPTESPADPLSASHAFIYRSSDSSFLFLKGSPEERIYPASITKLFTAYVALQYLEPDRQITVGNAIYTVPPDSSLAFLALGDVLTVEDLVHGMLLPSGGDAARVLAAEAGRVISGKNDISEPDAIAVFMEEVNHQAAAVGMTGTHFVTPDGFHDPDHYTTMADLLLLAKLSLDHPLIRRIASTTEFSVALPNRTLTWKNTNMLLHKESKHPEFYRETAIGLKTGFTNASGRCLLSAFIIDGETILAGVFGCPDPNMNFIAQFENTCYLYDTYIAQ